MPETGSDYLSVLLEDAKLIAEGFGSVSEVAITLVGRGPAPRVSSLTSDERNAIGAVRRALEAHVVERWSFVQARTVDVAMLLEVIRRLTGE